MNPSAFETIALPPGSTVKHYKIADLLAGDHQGFLYRADCLQTQVPVLLYEFLPSGLAMRSGPAIKAAPGKADALAKAVSSYATRLRAAGLVGHPALHTLEDIWLENATVYAVGPFKSGKPLLLEFGPASWGDGPAGPDSAKLVAWARVLCDALSALHRHDLFHGNLSPSMIRLLDTGELQLPLVGAGVHSEDTAPWIAPEQHPLNPKQVGIGSWTDVYQLSALIHQLMTSQAPPSVMSRWEGAPLERLAELGETYPAELLVATRKGLSMHAAARPQTPQKWLELAGLPDRRELPRYDSEASGFDAGSRRFPAAASPATGSTAAMSTAAASSSINALDAETDRGVSSVAASRPMELGTGHQPLPLNVQERLDSLERRKPEDSATWMWAFVLMALITLVAAVVTR